VGNLVVTLVNNDSKSHRVSIQGTDQSSAAAYVTVQPGEVKEVGAHPTASQGNVFFTNFTTKPGGLFRVYFQYGSATGVDLTVPVLDGAMPEYKSLVPSSTPPAEQ
jgi:hypothetical protein